MRISAIHTVDCFGLTVAQGFIWIKTPNAIEQPLPAQNFVNPGDATRKTICGIEKCGVRVRDFDIAAQKGRRNFLFARGTPAFIEQTNGLVSPNGPMAQQSANNAALGRFSNRFKTERRDQIDHDVVIVAGVKRDVVAPAFNRGANHVNRLIPIEWRDFDRDDVFDLRKSPPKGIAQETATGGRLQIKTDDRKYLRDAAR